MLRFYDLVLANAPACHFTGLEQEAVGGSLNLEGFQLHALPDVVWRGLPRPGKSWESSALRRDRWAHGMTHITDLSIAGNLLDRLPDGVGRLHCLTNLNAADNQLEALPDTLGLLTNLRTLHLPNNRLRALPGTVTALRGLELLQLEDNRIATIPDGLGFLPVLEKIDVRSNALITLPIDLCQSSSIAGATCLSPRAPPLAPQPNGRRRGPAPCPAGFMPLNAPPAPRAVLAVADNPVRMPPPEIVVQGLRQINDFLARMFRCQQTATLDLRSLDLKTIDYEILPACPLRRECQQGSASANRGRGAVPAARVQHATGALTATLPTQIPDVKRLLLSNNRMVTLAEARTEKSDDPAGAGGGAQRGAGRGKSARRAAALLSPNGAASPLEDRHSPPFLPAACKTRQLFEIFRGIFRAAPASPPPLTGAEAGLNADPPLPRAAVPRPLLAAACATRPRPAAGARTPRDPLRWSRGVTPPPLAHPAAAPPSRSMPFELLENVSPPRRASPSSEEARAVLGRVR